MAAHSSGRSNRRTPHQISEGDAVHPGFLGNSGPWILPSLVVCPRAPSAHSKSWALLSGKGGLRESPGSGSLPPRHRRHGPRPLGERHPSGLPPRADDEFGFEEGFTPSCVRCRRSPGEPRAKSPPIAARHSVSWRLMSSSRPRSGSGRRRRKDRRGMYPGGDRPPRAERGPSSETRPVSRRSCTSSRRGETRRPFPRCYGRRGDSERLSTNFMLLGGRIARL